MPIGDPRDRFFYPTVTLMMDSYILKQEANWKNTRIKEYHLKWVIFQSRKITAQLFWNNAKLLAIKMHIFRQKFNLNSLALCQ